MATFFLFAHRGLSVARRFARVSLLTVFAAPHVMAADITAMDPFGTAKYIPASPSSDVLSPIAGADPCALGPMGSPLSLFEAIERSLCNSPRTHETWANIKESAAQLGQSEAAYLPTINGSAVAAHDHSSTRYASPLINGIPEVNNVSDREHYGSGTVALNWVLFDFGIRSANVRNARQLLAAAEANHNAELQQVFATTARDYYAAIAGLASIDASRAALDVARQGLDIASVRVKDGVAAISDKWQAQTTFAESTYNLARAQGDYKRELGTLAMDMGLAPDTRIDLSQDLGGPKPNTEFVRNVRDLLDEALQSHPSLIAARAQLEAARAKADMIRAQGRPTVSLVTRRSINNQPVSLGTGLGDVGANTNDAYIGLELDVPFFEGFGRSYQIRGAEADVERQEESLHDSEQQVALSVWNNYQSLQVETENLKNTETVLESARLALDATQYRYKKGVGSIVELLNAQDALANANLQSITAEANWRSARLQLAASLGRLGSMDLLTR